MSFQNYDHSKNDFYEACGLTEDDAQKLMEKANTIVKAAGEASQQGEEPKGMDLSRLTEAYEDNLEKREIAVLLTQAQDELAHLKHSLMTMFSGQEGEA